MSNRLQDASLRFLGLNEGTGLYGLYGTEYTNHYYLLSGPGTRRLMAFPEVVGYASYLATLPATIAALRHLFPSGQGGDVDILTILRGGLNYPVEEACHRCGIRVRDIPKEYSVSRSYATKLLSDMRKDDQTTDRDFILDGSIRLVRVEALEDFWRRRGAGEA